MAYLSRSGVSLGRRKCTRLLGVNLYGTPLNLASYREEGEESLLLLGDYMNNFQTR